jgi:glutaconate CoA-transferase, subunit A
MLGSDLARAVGLETITCPYTGERLAAVPALTPDVAFIHVHRADRHGNAQIDGYRHMDADMARAARKVVVSTEKIVPTEEIAARPETTVLPHFAVDAVVEAPFGAYPAECYGLYEADFGHFDAYTELVREAGVEGARRYIESNVLAHPDFAAFIAAVGEQRLEALEAGARLLVPA